MGSAETRAVVGVDVGGTFTDCVGWVEGELRVAKVATTSDQSDGVMAGASEMLGGTRAASIVHGSTVATNALLERRGARTVLVTDSGFEDVIEIGRQDRPSLYDSFADRPLPLVDRSSRIGVSERLDGLAERVMALDPESVAVSLAYSFRDPGREEEIERILTGVPVSLSSRVAAEFREFERTSTTVLNAYLGPGVSGYLSRLGTRAAGLANRLQVMRSSGGLMQGTDASRLAAALLLSGPAGGVVGAAAMGRARGYERVITFDMGGTSTDVCRVEGGRPEVAYERTVDGYVCRMPSVAVNTVGAGGGSIAWLDPGGSMRVGPASAGADPGPASYGAGGNRPTVTDAHVVLGRIDPHGRLGGSLALDPQAAGRVLAELGDEVGLPPIRAARGVLEVVEAHMERAIRAVSVEQGVDPRASTLVAFGGAGGLHAVSLARRLGMSRVALPPHGGVFSALGLLMAPPRNDAARSVLIRSEQASSLGDSLAGISSRAREDFLRGQGAPPTRVELVADARYVGQAHEIPLPLDRGQSFDQVVEQFHAAHRDINGFARPEDPVEVVTVRAVASGEPILAWEDLPGAGTGPRPVPRRRAVMVAENEVELDVWWRDLLPAGLVVHGPCVIEETVGTIFLEAGDRARVSEDGTLEVTW